MYVCVTSIAYKCFLKNRNFWGRREDALILRIIVSPETLTLHVVREMRQMIFHETTMALSCHSFKIRSA